jgi:NMD protein affecting ribosome stability and mRNA decay
VTPERRTQMREYYHRTKKPPICLVCGAEMRKPSESGLCGLCIGEAEENARKAREEAA